MSIVYEHKHSRNDKKNPQKPNCLRGNNKKQKIKVVSLYSMFLYDSELLLFSRDCRRR